MTSPPSIPPRPTRTSPESESGSVSGSVSGSESEPSLSPPTIPAIPPRPKRSKSPLPDSESESAPSRVLVRLPVRKNTGIPQIGSRVPMYPNAGDVQAPAPAATPGGTRKAHVYREEWEMDEGAYGSKGAPRVNLYTRSSSDLNQSVAQVVSPPETDSPIPDEEIGYLATEHFARVTSPEQSGTPTEEQEASLSHIVSHSSTPGDEKPKVAIHLDPPTHHHHLHNHHPHRVPSSHPGTRPSTRPASPTKHDREAEDGDENDTEIEREHEHPILAYDEVQKRAGQGFQLPAVSPPLAAWRSNSRPQSVHPGGLDDEDDDVEPTRLSVPGSESRESLALSSLGSGEQPEPLFPDSDPEDQPTGTETPADIRLDKLKRPGIPESVGSSGHRFPSKDVWEEAPEFSQLKATVHTRPPSESDIPEEERTPKRADGNTLAEVPYIQGQPTEHYVPGDEVEFERKQKDSLKKPAQYQLHVNSSNRDDGLDRYLKRGNSADDSGEGTSRVKPKRFPSNDIWEDVPPSLQLSASIGEENATELTTATETTEPEDKRPTQIESSTTTTSKPDPPARPATRPAPKPRQPSDTPEKKPPVPDRPKPKVPLTRPARPSAARSTSAESPAPPPPAAKPKPTVPPRTGGKIAAKKAGFLRDLDNRLKLGPTAPKKEEAEKEPEKEDKEKAMLDDVRKGRARGPRGRKLPTASEKTEKTAQPQNLSLGVWAVWSVGVDGDIDVLADANEVLPTTLTDSKSKVPSSTDTKTGDEQKIHTLVLPEQHPKDAVTDENSVIAETPAETGGIDVVEAASVEGDASVEV